jgi:propionyl-CoA carboxylase alpha chain
MMLQLLSTRGLLSRTCCRPVQRAIGIIGDQKFLSTERKPFEKVLVANRGEIAERVFRTCQSLDIATVAVYSAYDANAPFVKAADEAICLGTSSTSYLDVPAVFDAVRQTGAQAVHPGYGFLSENANFAERLEKETGAVFLGPPVNAIHSLGDKLESKEIAVKGGVTVIPGYEGAVESLEQALQLCNESVPYPVLLKAANGGGGKGMRVCYNDQDVKEAWTIAKAEALKFFGDDRLLLEKFIENPHHIEFQVMGAPSKEGDGSVDIVIFPERECSIQRRNQKIIEESPSCLLHDETRRKMVSEVRQLCQTVGYQSAGTVEWLVDENQNYYFLEMNTRLQVEHPVTESVSGNVDLVKAMLWVGAGMGLPPELALYSAKSGGEVIMPSSGHAIEARIYAEDPLRGFLPSIGPLSPYIEPRTQIPNSSYDFCRVDTGVTAGHIVSQHYDPMLSKVVTFSPRGRLEAIHGMCRALDEYVIEGVRHNAKLCQAVLRNKDFQEGRTPTSFLPRHFPDGFKGVVLSETESLEFAAAAYVIGMTRQKYLHLPSLPGGPAKDHTDAISPDAIIVRVGGLFGKAYSVVAAKDNKSVVVQELDGMNAKGSSATISIDSDCKHEPARYIATVSLNGVARTLQVLPIDDSEMAGAVKLQMYGADSNVTLQTPREYELTSYMKEPIKLDTSNQVLSPMPGTLISFAVAAGDSVLDGQELCVVESMKMQNMIRSPKTAVIKALKCAPGGTLKVDQVIIEFEEPVIEEKAA